MEVAYSYYLQRNEVKSTVNASIILDSKKLDEKQIFVVEWDGKSITRVMRKPAGITFRPINSGVVLMEPLADPEKDPATHKPAKPQSKFDKYFKCTKYTVLAGMLCPNNYPSEVTVSVLIWSPDRSRQKNLKTNLKSRWSF